MKATKSSKKRPPTPSQPPYSIIKGVEVGEKVDLRALVNIYGAKIGGGTKIDSYTYIEGGVKIGKNVKIRPFTFIPEGVTIEDDVFIGPGVIFTNDKYPRAKGEWELLPTIVRRGASIGAGAVILPGIEIGEGAIVGAGAVVTKNVKPHAVVAGNPARPITKGTKRSKKALGKGGLKDQREGVS